MPASPLLSARRAHRSRYLEVDAIAMSPSKLSSLSFGCPGCHSDCYNMVHVHSLHLDQRTFFWMCHSVSMLAAFKVKLIVPLWHRTFGIDKTESRRRELWTACVFDKDAEHRRTDLSRFAAGSWLTTPPPRSAPPILHACKHPGTLSPVSHSILSMGQSVIASPSMLRYRAANFNLPAHPGLFC